MKSSGKLVLATAVTLLAGGTAFAAGQPPAGVPFAPSLVLLATGVAGVAVTAWWRGRNKK